MDIEKENMEAMSEVWELTPVQMQNYYYQSYLPDDGFLNVGIMVKLKPGVSPERMEDAINTVLENHPALNLRIFKDEMSGKLFQKYDKSFFNPVDAEECIESEIPQRIKELTKPFTIENSKLYRCGLIQTEERVYVYIVMHHILTDLMAINLLMSQFLLSYEIGSFAGKPDYYFYLLKQSFEKRQKEGYFEAKAYFEARFDKKLKEGVPLGLRPDYKSDGRTEVIIPYHLERKESRDVNFYKTAALLAIAWYNKEDFAFLQTIYADRYTSVRQDTAGIMAASLLLGLDLKKYNNPANMINDVREQNNMARNHTEYSYIEDKIGDPSMLVRFNYLKNVDKMVSETGLVDENVKMSTPTKMPGILGFSFIDSDKCNFIYFLLIYSQECYERQSIEHLAELYFKAMDYLETDSGLPLNI